MEKSESIKNISIALCGFQSELESLELNKKVSVKTKGGGSYSFKYATFSNGIEHIKPLLSKYKLSFAQVVESDSSVTTILMHESGEYIQGNLHLKTNENNAQAIGSMITYAKRYSLFSMLGVVADEDDDANSACGNEITQSDESKPWLNQGTEEWKKAVKYLIDGGNIDSITKKYRISKEKREKLLSESI